MSATHGHLSLFFCPNEEKLEIKKGLQFLGATNKHWVAHISIEWPLFWGNWGDKGYSIWRSISIMRIRIKGDLQTFIHRSCIDCLRSLCLRIRLKKIKFCKWSLNKFDLRLSCIVVLKWRIPPWNQGGFYKLRCCFNWSSSYLVYWCSNWFSLSASIDVTDVCWLACEPASLVISFAFISFLFRCLFLVISNHN